LNRKWGILPGMSWKHEEPFDEEEAADDAAPVPPSPLVNGNHGAVKAPAVPRYRPLFGPPSAVEASHDQAPGDLTSSQHGPPADIDSDDLENGDDAERSCSTSDSPPPGSSKRVLSPATAQAVPPSKRKPSHNDGQPSNASLGPVHSSRGSKVAGKSKGPKRRLNILHEVSPDGLPLSSGVDAPEPQLSPPPARATPRRSKKIQANVPSPSRDAAKTASEVPPKGAARSKPARKVAGNPTSRSSAKPQGVSKRQAAKTARGTARNK
jgi:hypothetical protein